MFSAIGQNKNASWGCGAERLLDEADQDFIPCGQFCNDIDHPGHVDLSKARYGWCIPKSFVRIMNHLDPRRLLVRTFDPEELGPEEPVQEPREPVFSFGRRRKSKSESGAYFEHEL